VCIYKKKSISVIITFEMKKVLLKIKCQYDILIYFFPSCELFKISNLNI